jgi:hypothetical protein
MLFGGSGLGIWPCAIYGSIVETPANNSVTLFKEPVIQLAIHPKMFPDPQRATHQ